MKTKILLVEDEEGLADSLKTELELEDMVVIWAKDGQEALDLFHEHEQELNLIILDWMLPKLDGFSVLRRIRKHSQMPVIMLTARDYIGDKVAGLTGGADDYMTKPFEVEELLARIEVSLRHSQKTDHQAKIYTVGDLTVDTTTKRVSRHNKIIPLTQREYELLVVLVMNEDEACSRDGLLDEVWGLILKGNPIF